MRRAFFRLDYFLSQKTKREQMIIFALPILIFIGIIFIFITPHIDEMYQHNKALLDTQKQLASILSEANTDLLLQELDTTLQDKKGLFEQLKAKSTTNQALLTALSPLTQNINTTKQNLFIYASGDVDMLEEILEEIEKRHFVFIENLNLNAYFSSDLEMKFEVMNFGERFWR